MYDEKTDTFTKVFTKYDTTFLTIRRVYFDNLEAHNLNDRVDLVRDWEQHHQKSYDYKIRDIEKGMEGVTFYHYKREV